MSIEVNSILALTNFDIVCVSTNNRSLRFYRTALNEFQLISTINNLPAVVTYLTYTSTFNKHIQMLESKIAIGDFIGDVIIINLLSTGKNDPFQSQMVNSDIAAEMSKMHEVKSYDFNEIVNVAIHYHHQTETTMTKEKSKQELPSVSAIQFKKLHDTTVKTVDLVDSGKYFVSTSLSMKNSMAYCNIQYGNKNMTNIPRYISSADGLEFECACAVGSMIVATGHTDKLVRLWNIANDNLNMTELEHLQPWTTSTMKSTELMGHDTTVHYVFYNKTNKYLYSVSVDCVIKMWDVRRATCLVSFHKEVIEKFDEYKPSFFAHFNQIDQVLVMVFDTKLVTIKCGDTDNDQTSSAIGYENSHTTAVVKTMYNQLFHVLISVSSTDSTIAVWNPSTGELIIKWTMAHTKVVYGETLPVEITAANFDPSGGLLVTGAENGTVHMWDPNDGTCLNRLQIPSKSRISEIIWLPNKVLVMASDKQVTEFNDPLTVSKGKVWLWSHDEAVLSACVKLPSLMVTTSSAGEMGFCRLETGQLVKKHKARMKPDKNRSGSRYSKSSASTSKFSNISRSYMSVGPFTPVDGGETREEMFKRLDIKVTPREHYAAVASHFLQARPEALRVGTLLVATRNGVVQIWCTYKVPKYVAQFVAIHSDNDYVTAMTSDSKSEFLFTSFNSGYVKTWYITNFGIGSSRHMIQSVKPSVMPSLRLCFPFLLESFFVGRADREHSLKNKLGPLLVNSYKAHVQRVCHIEYIDKQKLVVTSSMDKSIRIWTLGGYYIGTLGSPWLHALKTGTVNVTQFVIPSDIRREASFTTIKVLLDGANSDLRTPSVWDKLTELRHEREMEGKEVKRMLYGKKCPKQPLHDVYKKFMEVEISDKEPITIKVDELKSKVQIYKNVPLYELATIPRIVKLEDMDV